MSFSSLPCGRAWAATGDGGQQAGQVPPQAGLHLWFNSPLKCLFLLCPVAGPERRLVMVDSKLIKCRMSQTIGGETTPFTYKPLEGIQSCTVFEVNMWADASYLCVGMPDKVVLLKYNPSLGMYCVRKVRHCGWTLWCDPVVQSCHPWFVVVGVNQLLSVL